METQGILNAVFSAGNPALSTRSRFRITILNPAGFPPALNTRRQESQGIWNAVYDPATNTLRVSVV